MAQRAGHSQGNPVVIVQRSSCIVYALAYILRLDKKREKLENIHINVDKDDNLSIFIVYQIVINGQKELDHDD